jgi:hypothetical protein
MALRKKETPEETVAEEQVALPGLESATVKK